MSLCKFYSWILFGITGVDFGVITCRGDTFVILSRARGWWVVQRDPTGSGIVDTDIVKQGWVPAGCLLETNVPVASAIAEATAAKNGSSSDSSPDTLISKTPILPLSIISTSFPGIALMDYSKKGDEELDLVKDDALRVFKRYNHWSYVSIVIIFHLVANSTPFHRLSKKWVVIVDGYRYVCFPNSFFNLPPNLLLSVMVHWQSFNNWRCFSAQYFISKFTCG